MVRRANRSGAGRIGRRFRTLRRARAGRRMEKMTTFPHQYKSELLKAIESIELDKVNQAIELFRDARANGRRIFVCGNGGSAATASHFACDIVKGASFNKPSRFRIMALTDQLPTLTAYANDVSYD